MAEESKQAAYRQRQNEKLRELRRLQDLVANRSQPIEEGNEMQQHWFEVDIQLDRDGKKSDMHYMMETAQLSRFLEDVKRYNASPEKAPWHGTYATGDRAGYMPGMMTWAFVGLTVTGVRNADTYQAPPNYAISEGAVNMLISRQTLS